MTEGEIRERIVAVLCESGINRERVLGERNLAALIDSLKLLELTAAVEECLQRAIPDAELTEQNFASVPALMSMVSRLSAGAA
jgi:acyl carrier protein